MPINDKNKDKESLSIVKIGGNIVDNPEALESFLSDFHRLEGRKLLVHGGGVMASKMAVRLGIETKMVQGRRITDAETLKLVTMVYAGWINKNMVALLQKIGCKRSRPLRCGWQLHYGTATLTGTGRLWICGRSRS